MSLAKVIKDGVSLKNESLAEFSPVLRYCFALMGLRESSYPENHEILIVVDALKTQFGYLKLEEIRQAFLLATTGKIQVDVNEYGKAFNVALMGRILNAYIQQERIKHVEELNRERSKPQEPTEEEKKNFIKTFIKSILIPSFVRYKEEGVNNFEQHLDRIYKMMKKGKMIQLTDGEKQRLFTEHSLIVSELWQARLKQVSTSQDEHLEKKKFEEALKDPKETLYKKAVKLSAQKELVEEYLRNNSIESIETKLIQ